MIETKPWAKWENGDLLAAPHSNGWDSSYYVIVAGPFLHKNEYVYGIVHWFDKSDIPDEAALESKFMTLSAGAGYAPLLNGEEITLVTQDELDDLLVDVVIL